MEELGPNNASAYWFALSGTSSSSVDSSTAQQSNDLSIGVKVAIAIAIPVAVIAIIAAMLLYWRKKRSSKAGERLHPSTPAASDEQPLEMSTYGKSRHYTGQAPHPQELDGMGRQELDSGSIIGRHRSHFR